MANLDQFGKMELGAEKYRRMMIYIGLITDEFDAASTKGKVIVASVLRAIAEEATTRVREAIETSNKEEKFMAGADRKATDGNQKG